VQRGIDRKLAAVEQSVRDLETIKDATLESIRDINTKIAGMNNELAKQQVSHTFCHFKAWKVMKLLYVT
jgi:hypothetical protein